METDLTFSHEWQGETTQIALKLASTAGNGQDASGFVWLGGFRSDMSGTKAQVMVDTALEIGKSSLRFDYSGHGESGGDFVKGTISRWVDESLNVIRAHTLGKQVLVGSSMGGWIALRVAQELERLGEANRLAGLLLIAPAPDFTALLMEPGMDDAQRAALEKDGYIEEPSEYSDEPTIITKALIDDGRKNLVLDGPLNPGVPITILQGMADPDVPWSHALQLVEALNNEDVVVTLVKDGDHRLSRDSDLQLLTRAIKAMSDTV